MSFPSKPNCFRSVEGERERRRRKGSGREREREREREEKVRRDGRDTQHAGRTAYHSCTLHSSFF
jgi:hypothetical protein